MSPGSQNLKETQDNMKTWYDKKSGERVFNVGDGVLVLLSIPRLSSVVLIQLTRKSVMWTTL